VKSAAPDPELLIRYLLGELPEEECIKVEQDCLENDEIFEQLEAVEAELTDDYVRGVLSESRRKEFEKRLLTAPGGAENVNLARLITGRTGRRRSLIASLKAWIAGVGLNARLVQVSAVAVTLALVITIVLFSPLGLKSPQTPVAQSRPPTGQPATVQPTAPIREHASPQPPLTATFTLISGGVRGEGEANEIKIPRGTKRVRFRIELASKGYRRYRASLNRVEGEQLFIRNNVKARPSKTGETVVIGLPASVLPSGTSVLTLAGIGTNSAAQEVGKYVILTAGDFGKEE